MSSCLYLDAQVVSRAGSTADVVQRRLLRVTEAVKERYAVVLAQPWEVGAEGRLQAQLDFAHAPGGVLDASGRVVEMMCELALRLTPVRCRLLLSPERLPTSVRATALQQGAKARLFLLAKDFTDDLDPLLTGAFAGIGNLLGDWTERQAQFVRAVLRAGVVAVAPGAEGFHFVPGRKRREVAAAFGVSPSVVTECLQAAGIESFRYQVWSAASVLADVVSASPSDTGAGVGGTASSASSSSIKER